MSDIRYVVFSDMHLGAENSILTNVIDKEGKTDNTHAGSALVKLVACLRDVISRNKGTRKPTLVLNGDIVELALTTTNNAAMAFERFIELTMPGDDSNLFDDEVFYMSGNHDHNLWERSRNAYYQKYLETLKPGEYIQDELHCTTLFNPERVPVPFLNALFSRYPHLQKVNVTAAYPAHGLLSADGKKCVIICHGHYVESMYSMMTTMRNRIFPDRTIPQNLEELEAENFSWIDFFWSTLGRSGSVGQDINLIYDKIQDPDQVKMLLKNIADSFADTKKHRYSRWLDEKLLEGMLNITVGRLATNERDEPEVDLTPDATDGLKRFMEHYILNHLKQELKGKVPADMAFVFGHTHKPFERLITYEGYAAPVKVYNGGGWVVDTIDDQPLHGGSVVLIDDELDIVSLQMYKEGKTQVSVVSLPGNDGKVSSFRDQIAAIVDMKNEPWTGFAANVAEEVSLRHQDLVEIINSEN